MKLKGVEQLYEQTRPPAGPFWRELSDDQRKQFAKIVRAAESKGVDRAKVHGKGNINVASDGIRGCAWIDWSALDAELEDEKLLDLDQDSSS